MKEKTQVPDNMRQVLEIMEENLKGRRVFRYITEDCTDVQDKSAEEFFDDVRVAAKVLYRRGLAGRHIGITGRNSYSWMVALCAVFWSGSVAVLIDREISPKELAARVEQAEISGLIFEGGLRENVREASFPRDLVLLENEEMRKEAENCDQETARYREKRMDELACIFFTSGTTGRSKAVMMSERGLAAGICHRIQSRKFRALLAVLPFHHLAGFSSVLNALYLGAEVCLGGNPGYFYRYLEAMKPDYVFVVPSMLRLLVRKLRNGGPNGRLLGWDLHMINCGGATFRPEFLQMLLDRNITVLQGYGASEAGAIGFLWEMTADRPDTIGKPPEGLEVRIVDGELWLRSASVMMGYYRDSEETQRVLKEGWYITGDLCRQDEDGYLYLTGRKKNLIILSNGENVSPEEIEGRLCRCGDILESVVYAREDQLAVFIYPREAPEEQKESVREKIRHAVEDYNESVPLYRQIKKVEFMEKPPERTSSGKLQRRSMQEGKKE